MAERVSSFLGLFQELGMYLHRSCTKLDRSKGSSKGPAPEHWQQEEAKGLIIIFFLSLSVVPRQNILFHHHIISRQQFFNGSSVGTRLSRMLSRAFGFKVLVLYSAMNVCTHVCVGSNCTADTHA
jgi:hypothetical protein